MKADYCTRCGRFRELPYLGAWCTACLVSWYAENVVPLPAQQEVIFDGCCGEGGASAGYVASGAYVIGCDSNPACRDGYLRSGGAEFICADVLDVLADKVFMSQFSFVHYSPPCQHFSRMCRCRPELRAKYPDLITPGRPLLDELDLPYVIENVTGARAWLHDPVTMCMWMFGRETYRHRLLEAGGGFTLSPPPAPAGPGSHPGTKPNRECGWPHPVRASKAGHYGADRRRGEHTFVSVAGHELKEPVLRVMEISWMSSREAVAEAIPPYLAGEVADQLAAWRSMPAAA